MMTTATGQPSFDDEIFEYWIPRLVADGVDANDIQSVRPKITNWDDWPVAWSAVADQHYSLAHDRLSNGSLVTAGEAFVRASLCYHVGQVVAGHAPDLKRKLQKQKEAAFREAAPHLLPPAERIEIRHEDHVLPGYLRLSAAAENAQPCVILVPGLDSTKEDFFSISEMCVKRGLASFAYDGPGQGEVRDKALLKEGYERSILSVYNEIESRPEIDAQRIGLLGRSLGGYYILRAASLNARVKALAVFGGCYDLGDWETMPKTILDGFLWTTDSATYDEARTKMGSATLDDCIANVLCPTLIVHGKRDAIFHYKQAQRIADSLGDLAEWHIETNGVHCCHNLGFQYRTLMADWMARTLTA